MSNDLAKMLQLLTSRYAKKGNFANYTYNDDMQSYAMLMLVKTWNSFDPAKSSNPFAFFTQCIKNSFIQYLNYEKRQRDIRDRCGPRNLHGKAPGRRLLGTDDRCYSVRGRSTHAGS